MSQQEFPATSPSCIVVWDCGDAPVGVTGEVWGWQSYTDGARSVPRYLERHADRLRARYLAFIHDLGQTIVGGRRVVEQMSLPDGFSFWWMTLLVEKSPFKSPRIYDALRLMALEEMLAGQTAKSLVLHSPDRVLATAIGRLCMNLGLAFEWRALPNRAAKRGLLRALYRKAPHALQGLIASTRHICRHWPLRKVGRPDWFGGRDAVFLCSFFVHLDAAQCARGEFHSHQWEQLPAHLRQHGRRLNWIQHFLFSPTVPDTATGISWVRAFNRDAGRQGNHAFLDTFLSAPVLLAALKNWAWLNLLSLRLRGMDAAFKPAGSAVSLWPLLQDDWFASLRGRVAFNNCLWLALFDRAMKTMPRQETGLFIFENQAWERALLHAWKRHGHGEIIGAQHATAPFWHTYYFDDPRSLRRDVPQAMPQADRIAVNGPAAAEAFVESGYPPELVVEVEALRYLGLAALAGAGRARQRLPDAPLRVLILGDTIESSMHHLLSLAEGAALTTRRNYRFSFKPHPHFHPSLVRYPGLAADVTTESLQRILPDYDIALAANGTSAAVDAYVAGLAVIIGLDGAGLNLSPLRGHAGVAFAGSTAELVEALRAASSNGAGASTHEKFFFLDPLLSRWTSLLSLKSHDSERSSSSLPSSISQ